MSAAEMAYNLTVDKNNINLDAFYANDFPSFKFLLYQAIRLLTISSYKNKTKYNRTLGYKK